MAGHSQWNNIKFRKAKQDAQKSKIFSKFSKEIYLYAKNDPDPKTNPSLRNIINQAKDSEVPNHIVEKAIKKASEKGQEGSEVIYEAIQGNYAFIILAITNNKARTAAEVREILRNHNASIGKCQYLFESLYLIQTPPHELSDRIIELCERMEEQYGNYYLFFAQNNASEAYAILKDILLTAKLIFVPSNVIESAKESENLLNDLEELEDIYQVFCNTFSF